MEILETFASSFSSTVWGLPMVFVLFGAGLVFSLYFGLPQLRLIKHAILITAGKYDNPDDQGEITHFQALSAALSATIGLGNIAGVAVAIASGGPGAIFWMWVAGLFGMATKFTSITLSLYHRQINPDTGVVHGGPMYTIINGLGKKYYLLAVAFSLFTIGGAFGAGNLFQSNQMASILHSNYNIPNWITGLFFMALSAVVLVGGIKRIGDVASKLVPSMVVLYFLASVGIIVMNLESIPGLLAQIFQDAFSGTAAIGGFGGIAFKEVVIQGVRRAVFSNEAGLGSAAMAHSAAKSNPIQEGLVGMLGPFIDTIVVCTLTALVLLITGVWNTSSGLEGSAMTALAFSKVYGNIGVIVLSLSIVLFAFSSIISWSYYGEQGVTFIFGEKGIPFYRIIFCMVVFVGAVIELKTIVNLSDGFLGLMLIPNLFANIMLAKDLRHKLKKYESDLSSGRI